MSTAADTPSQLADQLAATKLSDSNGKSTENSNGKQTPIEGHSAEQVVNEKATAALRNQFSAKSTSPTGSPANNRRKFPELDNKRPIFQHTIDAIGRQVKLEKANGETLDGILEKINPDMSARIVFATKRNGDEDQPLRGEDLTVPREDIMAISFKIPKVKGFRTDKDYNASGKIDENAELEEWQPDPEVNITAEQNATSGRGWSVDEMFRANDKLGVKSTFHGIEQYCTAEPEGDEEARRRADQIAREIEQSSDSQKHRMLENDDEERDLDKETKFDKHKRQNAGGFNQKDRARPDRNFEVQSPRNSFPNGSNANNRFAQNQQSRPTVNSPRSTQSTPSGQRTVAPTTAWRQDMAVPPPTVTPVQANMSVPPPNYTRPDDAKFSPAPRAEATSPRKNVPAARTPVPPPHADAPSMPRSPTLPSVSPNAQAGTSAATSPANEAPEPEKKEKKRFVFNPNAAEFVPTAKLNSSAPPVAQAPAVHMSRPVTTQFQGMPPGAFGQISPMVNVNVHHPVLQIMPGQQYPVHQPPPAQPQLMHSQILQQQQQYHQLQQQHLHQQLMQQQQVQRLQGPPPQADLSQVAHIAAPIPGQAQTMAYIQQQGIVHGVQPYQPGIPPPVVQQAPLIYNQGVVYGYNAQGAPTM